MQKSETVCLLVWDEPQGFPAKSDSIGFAGITYKSIKQVYSQQEIEDTINSMDDTDLVFLIVHVFANENLKGITKFVNSKISTKFPNLPFEYVSSGVSQEEIKQRQFNLGLEVRDVFKYFDVHSNLDSGRFKPVKVGDVKYFNNEDFVKHKIDYAIIAALDKEELNLFRDYFELEKTEAVGLHMIEFGHLKGAPEKRLILAAQVGMGMVDSGILSAYILTAYNPKYLIMLGVMAGKPLDTEIADLVLVNKVFLIDRGKIKNEHKEAELVVENIEAQALKSIDRQVDKILDEVRNSDKQTKHRPNAHFGPIACVNQVVDKNDYIQENVVSVDRKAVGLEMESYGVVRACKVLNDGKTIPIIIKSVMDVAQGKTDVNKAKAAWTSAAFVRWMLELGVI